MVVNVPAPNELCGHAYLCGGSYVIGQLLGHSLYRVSPRAEQRQLTDGGRGDHLVLVVFFLILHPLWGCDQDCTAQR